MIEENLAAWQQYAEAAERSDPPGPGVVPERLEWTQVPGLGPGHELLGELVGRRVLELGCGSGAAAAFLAIRCGAFVTAIDGAPTQVARAQARWEHPRLSFQHAEAHEYLRAAPTSFDRIISIFGALDFVPPRELLPLARARLRDDGLLALSTVQAAQMNPPRRLNLDSGQKSTPLQRPLLSPRQWTSLVQHHGMSIEYRQLLHASGETHPMCFVLCCKTND